jgi:transposase
MGRSRGGLTTKLHALVDAQGLPVRVLISEGQAWDGHYARQLIEHLRPGIVLLADRAYDSNDLRRQIAEKGARANIPPMPNRLAQLPFNKRLYRKRNLIERFFSKLKHYRAIATRYEKSAENYLAAIKLACLRIWLRHYESVT